MKNAFFKWHAREIIVVGLAAALMLTQFSSCKSSGYGTGVKYSPGNSIHKTGRGHVAPCAR